MAAPTGSLYFQENEIILSLENMLNEIFSTDESIEKFGTTVDIRSEYDNISDDLSFPCILISFDDYSADTDRATSTQPQNFTSFVLVFEVFAKSTSMLTPTAVLRQVAEYLIQNLQQKFPLLSLSSNRSLPNLDDTISRRQITFLGKINNETHMIYSN